jgi:hypothetical protein
VLSYSVAQRIPQLETLASVNSQRSAAMGSMRTVPAALLQAEETRSKAAASRNVTGSLESALHHQYCENFHAQDDYSG